MLTTDQQERMRRLTRRSPAFIGMRIEVHDDHVEVVEPESLRFGYESLSERLAQTPADDWADTVDAYFRRAIESVTTDTSDLDAPTDEMLGRVYQRLLPADMEYYPDYSFSVTPDLWWALFFDQPDMMVLLNDERVGEHGLERLGEAGYANLCREVPDEVAVAEGGIYLLEGSDYVGSLALVMAWVTESLLGVPDPPHGVLVGAPARNITVFHLITDRASTQYAVGEIARLTAELHDESGHPLSRRVHWWRPGRLDTIAYQEQPAYQHGPELRTDYPDDFVAMLDELPDAPPPSTLTEAQHERMLRLARRSPAFLGMRIEVHDDHVEVLEPEQLQLGYASLSARLAQTPAEDWPDALDDHFRSGLAALKTGLPQMDGPTSEVAGHIYQRLMPLDAMPFIPDYAFAVAPGLMWTLAYDLPEHIRLLNDEHLSGHDFEELCEAGVANLMREVPNRVRVSDGEIFVMEGSDYAGSLLLIMPRLTELMIDELEPPHGVLVGAPARNVTIFHPIRDAAGARHALGEIARLTSEYHANSAHPLNPCVHWWRSGRVETVAVLDGDELRTDLPDELAELLS